MNANKKVTEILQRSEISVHFGSRINVFLFSERVMKECWVDSFIMLSSRLKKLIYSSRAHSIKLTLPDNRLERRAPQLFRYAKNCYKMLMKYCRKIVQIRNRKNFLFGHFSHDELVIFVTKLAGWSTETYYVRVRSHESEMNSYRFEISNRRENKFYSLEVSFRLHFKMTRNSDRHV